MRRWKEWFHNYMRDRYEDGKPKGRSLYIWCHEEFRYAIWYMIRDWIAARFPPTWIYEVWTRDANYDSFLTNPEGWVGGEIAGFYLHLSDAERAVESYRKKGFKAGWVQHSLAKRYYEDR